MTNDYKNILALDSSGPNLILGVAYGDDRSVKSESRVDKSHGIVIARRIQDSLESAGLKPEQLDGIIVCLGPGSFTGLRISLSMAKGIAIALSVPVVGVSLFEIARFKKEQLGKKAHAIVLSRKGEYYLTSFENGLPTPTGVCLVKQNDLVEIVGKDPLFGIGWNPAEIPEIKDMIGDCRFLSYDGADLLNAGLSKFKSFELDELIDLEPMYLQKAIAEIRFDEKHGQK